MRILHVIQRYWPAPGGAEAHLHAISRHLVRAGHEVTVLTSDALDFELFWDPSRRRVAEAESEHEGVRIVRFPVRHLPLSSLTYRGARRLLWALSLLSPIPTRGLWTIARYTPHLPDMRRWLEATEERYDVVAGITICFEPLMAAGLQYARRQGVPYVAYPLTHLGAGPEPGRDSLSRFYTMRHQVDLVLASDALVAQTPTEARFYVERGLPPERAMVAGPGIEPAEVMGGEGGRLRSELGIDEPLVACIGSMSRDKGTVHVVEAMRALWAQGERAHLVLAGALLAPFARYLRRLPARERGRLHVLGPVDERTKRDLLAAADVLAMPSRTDSFGIAYLEAWLYGVPVIGARTWGVTDVIADGRDGLLVPFGDVPGLARALARLLHDHSYRQELGARGREKVLSAHTWARKLPEIRALYERLGSEGPT